MSPSRTLAESRQQEVRVELNRLLESAAFRSSKRCREFLEHVVVKTVAGQIGGLKERTIGVELFGLPPEYDTSQHTIVRVTASETRKKLAQSYQSRNGSHESVRIDLPPGSYSAEFTWIDQAFEAEVPAPALALPPVDSPAEMDPPAQTLPPPAWISRRWLVGGAGAAGLLGAGFGIWQWRGPKDKPPRTTAAVLPPDIAANATGTVRIAAGAASPYLDRNGQTWGVDRYFTGGFVQSRPAERVVRTLDPDLYRKVRLGDFRYDIPLEPGEYQLHLHFAETGLSDFVSAESSGEGQRVFRISTNGKTLLNFFDVVADAAGANIADERVFRNIKPADDGHLHLAFSPQRGSAMVSGIELFKVPAGEVIPLKIRSGWPTPWRDGNGGQWRADCYFLGGNALVRRTNPVREGEAPAPESPMYASERWGHFSYALPVPDGRYRLTLRFCEGHLGPRNTGAGGVGGRVFDVFCNGVALLRSFDIVKEAGGEGRAIHKVFQDLRPNAQGKILLTFVPIVGMACVNGLELVAH